MKLRQNYLKIKITLSNPKLSNCKFPSIAGIGMKSRVSITKIERVVKNISNLFVKVPTLIYCTPYLLQILKRKIPFLVGIFLLEFFVPEVYSQNMEIKEYRSLSFNIWIQFQFQKWCNIKNLKQVNVIVTSKILFFLSPGLLGGWFLRAQWSGFTKFWKPFCQNATILNISFDWQLLTVCKFKIVYMRSRAYRINRSTVFPLCGKPLSD